VSRALDSATEGLPLVVFNPLSIPREDVVEARIRFPGAAPASLRVLGPDGQEVPSQVLSADEEAAEILFLAELPAVGFSVHEVRSGAPREVADTGLQVGQDFLESPRYRVELDTAGDVARILDRAQGRELLTAPLRLALFDDLSPVWPAWEIMFPDLLAGPRGHVEGPAEVTVVEEGPVRVALEVRRTLGDTVIRQVVRLSAGAAGDRVELDLSLRWRTLGTLLKLELPLEAEAPVATYDLGLGVIQRGVNTPELYEVPAQQWADLGAGDGSHGVLVTTDCKYGWDRPEPGLLRLTLLHTPALSLRSGYYNQFLNDVGDHRVLVALAGHEGSWRDGAPWVAARLNQPPLAFQVPRRQGSERTFSFLSVDHPGVAARALKQAEDGDGFILRLQELRGEPAAGVRISFPAGLDSAREVWGSEEDRGPATLDGGALVLDMAPFALRSFRVRPRGPEAQPDPLPGSLPLALPFDTDVVSPDDARADGAMGPVAGVPRAWPAALFPAEVLDGGVRFVLGPTGPGEDNAVTCQGQEIPLAPREGDALHLLVAAVGDREATFRVGDLEHHAALVDWTGWVGQWDSRVPDLDQDPVLDIAAMAPAFVKAGEIGLYATHRHRPDGDDPFVFCYLQRLVIPLPEGATALVLPKDDAVRVLAATLAPSGLAQAAAVSPLHDLFDADAQGRPWEEDGPPPDPSPEGAPDAGGPQDGQEPGADPDGRSRDRGCTAGSPAAASPGILLAAAALLGALRRKTVLRPAAG
ncbi:MAG: hypothetical protein FJ098_07935, partial [Deltaproteobacteria bacterium]|nr:hypothetical protein [Deltaproteobacteria bacterium]